MINCAFLAKKGLARGACKGRVQWSIQRGRRPYLAALNLKTTALELGEVSIERSSVPGELGVRRFFLGVRGFPGMRALNVG